MGSAYGYLPPEKKIKAYRNGPGLVPSPLLCVMRRV